MEQFLYPKSRQYPFDEVCERIVKEIEQRAWDIPGVTVEFDTYGTGDATYRYVSNIEGDDFRLHFCRPQGLLAPERKWNDIAAVNRLVIPRHELTVYDDESGPTLAVYVGNDWDADKQAFKHGLKVNSKLYEQPRTYLLYHGHGYNRRRAGALAHNNDLGREYELEPGDIPFYETAVLFERFRLWLEDHVLSSILDAPVRPFVEPPTPDPTPMPAGFDLFCFGEHSDADRITKGADNPPSDRYGMQQSYRLANLGVRNDGTFNEVAYDGFVWCGIGAVDATTQITALDIPGFYRWSDRFRYLLRVRPKHADGVWVADMGAREVYKQKVFDEHPEQDRLDDQQFAEFERMSPRSLVPITEYRGGYTSPVVLINRELSLDEVDMVSGPHPDWLGRL